MQSHAPPFVYLMILSRYGQPFFYTFVCTRYCFENYGHKLHTGLCRLTHMYKQSTHVSTQVATQAISTLEGLASHYCPILEKKDTIPSTLRASKDSGFYPFYMLSVKKVFKMGIALVYFFYFDFLRCRIPLLMHFILLDSSIW